jgi:hypothetical protein
MVIMKPTQKMIEVVGHEIWRTEYWSGDLRDAEETAQNAIAAAGYVDDDVEELRTSEIVTRLSKEIQQLTEVNAELITALKFSILCMEAHMRVKHPGWNGDATPTSVIGMARAAIAKAEGRHANEDVEP